MTLESKRTTRAVVTEGDGRTTYQEVELPAIEAGDLELDLEICGLCGTDLFKLGHNTVPAGTVLGHELVGCVRSRSTGFATGTRVVVPHHVACGQCGYCRRGSETMCEEFRRDLLAPGGFAETLVVRRRAAEYAARVLPPRLSPESAIFLEPAACVLRGIRKAQLPASGGRAAILGAGSMGLLHLLVLKALHPEIQLLVVEPLEERARLAAELGADHTSDASAAELGRLAREVAQPELRSGVDAVFDTVGGKRALDTGLALLREGGTLVLFAHDLEDQKHPVDLNQLFKSEQRIVGTYSGSLSEQDEIFELLLSRRLDPTPLVTHRLPLSAFERAVELCQTRQALKVLLEPDR